MDLAAVNAKKEERNVKPKGKRGKSEIFKHIKTVVAAFQFCKANVNFINKGNR